MNTGNNLLQKWVVLVCMVFALFGCSGGGGGGGGTQGKVTLSGTVATGLPLANTVVTIKGKNGVIITTTTDSDGKYTDADVSTLTKPYLLKVLNATGTGYLYSVATATGTANIHPFTDLIIRNWYKVQNSDIDTEFSGTLDPANLPTVEGIKTIEGVIRNILETSLASAGVSADFNLLTSSFDANQAGFDQVLDETDVVIDDTTGSVDVIAVDPVTGGTSTLVTTDLTTDLSVTPAPDTTTPSDPLNPEAMSGGTTVVTLFWDPSTDDTGVAGYNIYRGISGQTLTMIATSPYPSYKDTGLTSATNYCYQVEAVDAAGNKSAKIGGSGLACATTIADSIAPAAPTSLAATANSSSQIDLTWLAPVDSDVVGYDLYRDGVKVATAKTTSYSDTGLASSTTYSYTVKAKDAALNVSVASSPASATTLPGIPSAPTGVTATATVGSVTISWSAVNGASTYNIYMATEAGVNQSNYASLAGGMTHTTDATSYDHTGLTDGTTYYFVVTADSGLGESIESAQVSATPTSSSISGTVSGTGKAGVTITVTDAQSTAYTATTSSTGTYSVSGLANGTYTITPSKTGYTFSPASRSVTISSGANSTGQNFTATAVTASTYSLTGTVTGPYVEGVTITLSGAGTGTTTTNAGGTYSFTNLVAGTYTVTPSLAGYNYSPSVPSVSIGANTTQNFTASSAIASYSISGTVTETTAKTGSIYLRVYDTNCTDCGVRAGTTIPTTGGAYTIRGLQSGSYVVNAEMDALGSGVKNAGNPAGNSTTVNITGASAAGVNVTVADVTPPTPVTPTGLAVSPYSSGAFVSWDTPKDNNGTEIASDYKIYWSTNPDATTGGSSATVPAMDDGHYFQSGLANGTYYYKISALVGTAESSASAVTGPVTIGAATGANTLSGTVTYTGLATGPLYVGVYSDTAGVYVTRIANSSSPEPYSVSGIPNGSYSNFAFIDMNNNGFIDMGDINNTDGNAPLITISGNTTGNLTLSSANAKAEVNTNHGSNGSSDWYNLNMQVNDGIKRAVAVTLVSGKDIPVPLDLGEDWEFRTWQSLNTTVPTVGASYVFKVTYSDGTTENISASVTGVLGTSAMAQNLVVDITSGASTPTFTWAAPSVPPASYTYRVGLFGNAFWWYPQDDGLPSTTLSALYNADGGANPSSLATGVSYTWEIQVEDANGNSASLQSTYTPQ